MFHVDPRMSLPDVTFGSVNLGRSPIEPDAAPEVKNDFDLGYAMGLIVGEGSFSGDRRQPVLAVKLHERDPAPLLFLLRALGGKVYGPYHHECRRFYVYFLRGPDLRRAIPLFLHHLPQSWKRHQFLEWGVRWGFLDPLTAVFG